MVATLQPMNIQEFIDYVNANAPKLGLDPAAVLAVSQQEGLHRAPPATPWSDPTGSDPNAVAFGPMSYNSDGAGAPIVQQQGSAAAAQTWAWTPAGVDYMLQQLKGVA